VNVWDKPLKFELSLVVFFGTLAWFWGYLTDEQQRGRFLKVLAVISVAGVAFEMACMILQSARGVASHFNNAAPFEAIMFGLMGLAAIVFTAMPLILGVLIARGARPGLPRPTGSPSCSG
jgi:hypothetical protein